MKAISIKNNESIDLKTISFTPSQVNKAQLFNHFNQLSQIVVRNPRKIFLYIIALSLFGNVLLLVSQAAIFTEGLVLYAILLTASGLLLLFIGSTILTSKSHSISFAVDPSRKKIPKDSWDEGTGDLGLSTASHIQRAMLPPKQQMQQILPEHFVFFRPKEHVSGDFYWMDEIQGKTFLIAGDCTGHGVSGALMTMLCNQALENIIIQKQIYAPDQILSQLDMTLRKTLHTEQTHIRNGLDAVVCVIEKSKRTLQFAGARSHLVIVQNNQLNLVKGDIYSINGHRRDNQKRLSFSTHRFDLTRPATIYMFSDGIQDQFGGTNAKEPFKGQKFTRSRLLQLLENVQPKPLAVQKTLIIQAIDNWQGSQPQIDDMMLIGVRI
ncbi:hypothetical protein BKI52_08815 [marine bacterium AO1-C]|nr:hypothetical protein BKI52_08815 [marine bacterium AO1-C]